MSRPGPLPGATSPSALPPGRANGSGRRAGRLDPDELAALEDQRAFLLRSLEDLEREHAAGDLDDDDHRTLRDDYTARAAETIRAIDEQRAAFAEARTGRSRGRTLAVLGGVAAFAVVAGLLVAASLGARGAGDTASGGISVSQSPSQRAQQCISDMAPQAPSAAIDCFQGVLEDDPRNVVALAWLGWQLELSSGLVPDEAQAAELQASAERLVENAVTADPDYSYARAFRAVIAFRRGDFARAQQYLAEFRERDPSPDAEQVIDQFDLDAQIAAALAGETPAGEAPADEAPATTTPG